MTPPERSSTLSTHISDSVIDIENHITEPSSPLSFTEKYKIGFKYIPELYSGSTPFGKIMFVFKIIAVIGQCMLGIVTILITKDQNPEFRYFLFVILYTLILLLTLLYLPYSFTNSQPTLNVPELVKLESNRSAVRSGIYVIQFVLLLSVFHRTVNPRSMLLFYTALVYLVLYIISMILPVFLILLGIIFFPCTYLYFRHAVQAEEKAKVVGASGRLHILFTIR
ncbi:hypothetical protein BC833DRAFT_576563 [Globomyces pollinis-pini]|nr:hypothetical protein BC833DRAFT_576563 [Globomyces pollinis-pini]